MESEPAPLGGELRGAENARLRRGNRISGGLKNRKKSRRTDAVAFSGKTETEARCGPAFQNQVWFFSSIVAFLQQMQALHARVPETVSRDTRLYISDCLFSINNYKMITLILSGRPITRFTEEKSFFSSAFSHALITPWLKIQSREN